jgi:hypothetical protein
MALKSDAASVRNVKQLGGEQRDGLGHVETQAARLARLRQLPGDVDEELVAFLRRQVHGVVSRGPGGTQYRAAPSEGQVAFLMG